MPLDADTRLVLDVPADCSQRSLEGWVAGIRGKLFDFPPDSDARREYVAEAQKQLAYAGFLVRKAKARAAYLDEESRKLGLMMSTVVD
jgi:hypothetical protein